MPAVRDYAVKDASSTTTRLITKNPEIRRVCNTRL